MGIIRSIITCTLICISFSVLSQTSVTVPQDYHTQLDRAGNFTPLGDNLFGDVTDLSTGSTTFHHTVVSLPGNSKLPVQAKYSYGFRDNGVELGFAWQMDRPYLSGTFSIQTGWVATKVGGDPTTARCSQRPLLSFPPEVSSTSGKEGTFFPEEYWHGNHLVLPGGASELMHALSSSDQSGPSDGDQYTWTTKNHWYFSCLDLGNDSEGFLGVSPDGTKYYFDTFDNLSVAAIKKEGEMGGGTTVLQRREVRIYASKIEDRFGNWVKYNRTGDVLTISSNDGRQLTVTSNSSGQTISDGSHTWHVAYSLTDDMITGVDITNPDGHHWILSSTGSVERNVPLSGCSGAKQTYEGQTTINIHDPSGAVGVFHFKLVRLGESYVRYRCVKSYSGSDGVIATPDQYDNIALVKKDITGAGLKDLTWEFTYDPPNECYIYGSTGDDTECTDSSPTTRSVEVLGPDNTFKRYTFSNKADSDAYGLLLKKEIGNSSANILRTESTQWYAVNAIGNAGPIAGGSPGDNLLRVAKKETITQDGNIFTWQAEDFNGYGQITKAKRYNDVSDDMLIEEQYTYHNDTLHWVLGLPEKVINLATGDTVSKNIYNDKGVLTTHYSFDQKLASYTYNSAGQVSSFSDGNEFTTTYSNYKRGIPQTIVFPETTVYDETHPNGVKEHTYKYLNVNDFGHITSITDQAGYTTHYAYDAIGRLTKITYPGSWNPKVFTYNYVTGAERGISADHWKRTVSQGGARHVTYYDALLRPILTDTSINGVSGSHISHRTTYNWKGLTTLASWPVLGSPSLSAITNGITTAYDVLGRPRSIGESSELGALTTKVAYLGGASKQITDPKGNVTTISYQVFDQPSGAAVIKVQPPEEATQTITRDIYGSPTAITQSGSDVSSVTKHLIYDSHHRLCRTTEPESRSTLIGYDGANNPTWITSGVQGIASGCGSAADAVKTKRTYDAMNRVTAVTYPDGTESATFAYNARGDMVSAISGLAKWSFNHGVRGFLTSETLDIDGYRWPIRYTYDANGNINTMTYPDGKIISYAPDELGRPTQAGSYAIGVHYLADGHISDYEYADGSAYVAIENERNLPKSLSYADSQDTLDFSQGYVYDANANLTKVMDLTEADKPDRAMGYDNLNRLISANMADVSYAATYSYDAFNNIHHLISGGVDYTYVYQNNQLTSITSGVGGATLHTFGYDLRGNTISKDSYTNVFDQANRLRQTVGVNTYDYDAAGRRVKKTDASGNTTYYAYNSNGQLVWQYAPTSTGMGKGSDYVYLGKKLVARLDREVSSNIPASPTSITVPATSAGTLTVQWAASDYAVTYRLEQQQDGGAWRSVYHGEGLSGAIHVSANGNYVYRVAACNGAGCSAYKTSSIVVVTLPPDSAPTLTTPSEVNASGSYTVSWGAVSSANSYTLQEHASGHSWGTIYTGSSRSKAVSGKSNNTWSYHVRACNVGGCGPWSSTKVTVVLHPPAAPATITVPSASDESMTVSWSSVSTANSYTLRQSIDGASYTTVYTGAATSKARNLTKSGSYRYAVKACNTSGCSSWRYSDYVTVTIPPSSAPGLSAPSTNHTGSYTVSWGSVSSATSYTMQQRFNSGSWTAAYNGSGDSKVISKVKNGTYGYRVRACNAGGCGPWSSTHTVHVSLPPNSVSISKPYFFATVPFTAKWSSAPTATSYTFQEKKSGGSWKTLYSGGATSTLVDELPSDVYSFRARACNSIGCSAWTTTDPIEIASPIPKIPTNAEVVPYGNYKYTAYRATWDAVEHVTHYQVKRYDTGAMIYDGPDTSFTMSLAFLPDIPERFSFSVRACNVNYCSGWAISN